MWLTFLVLSEIILPAIGWIAMKSGTDIHGLKRKNLNYFGNPLTFPLAPQSMHLSIEVSQQLLYGLGQNLVKTFMVPRG